MSDGIVIAGGGLAAQRCCETLRAKGFDGPIRVLCQERHPPYDRPPLSKEVLTGDMPAAATALRPRAWYDDHSVDLLLGVSASRLDIAATRVEISRGPALRYEQLLIATGAAPRTLPSLEGYDNVATLRTLPDAQRLARALHRGARIVIVGAGFIGLEVAAAARARGAEVTIVEAASAPLASVLGPALGAWFADMHRSEGVEVLVSAQIDSVKGGRRARELVLAEGRRLRCDHVVVGVGVDPATRWLDGSGLDSSGVIVDAAGRTAAPGVYAAGDAARVHDRALGRPVRTEHWEAAARQGSAAARAMLGQEPAAMPPASFWSDQYGTRIQYVGYAAEADRAVTQGDLGGRQFAVEFTRAGATVAALLVGRPRELSEARRRVQAGLESLQPTTTRSAA
jgi:3-phenylpropionate/trans-cinnamate dioxygenase ferredoxin reductase component